VIKVEDGAFNRGERVYGETRSGAIRGVGRQHSAVRVLARGRRRCASKQSCRAS